MSSILQERNKSAYQYCESIQEKMHTICKPLSNLDITYFGHTKIFNDGSFFILTNAMNFQRDYLFKEGGFGNIFTEVYSNTASKQYFLALTDKESIQKDRTIALSIYHNVFNIFNIYQNNNDHISGYFFGTSNQDPMISSFYFKNLSLLEHFIHYFNEKGKDLIDITDTKKLAHFDHQFNFQQQAKENFETQKIQEFLKHTQLKNFSLSPRQKECLFLLTRGKTAKQIGRILGIDHRTVETHMISLKNKLDCNTKEQLIEKAFESGLAHLVGQGLIGK